MFRVIFHRQTPARTVLWDRIFFAPKRHIFQHWWAEHPGNTYFYRVSVVPPGIKHGKTMGKPWENHGKTMGKWCFIWKDPPFFIWVNQRFRLGHVSEVMWIMTCPCTSQRHCWVDIPKLVHGYGMLWVIVRPCGDDFSIKTMIPELAVRSQHLPRWLVSRFSLLRLRNAYPRDMGYDPPLGGTFHNRNTPVYPSLSRT